MNTFKEKDEKLFQAIKSMQNGEFDTYELVYELSEKYIYKIIYDIVKNHHTTEDIMQETYMSIFSNIHTLQNPQAFYSWAGRIATNNTLQWIRKNNKEVLAFDHDDEEGSAEFIFERAAMDTEEFIPESVLMNQEQQRLIADIIDQLPIDQKLCVQYFYFEDMSVQEIADQMGCSTGTVKSRLNYARKAIKGAVVDLDVKHGTKLYSLGGPAAILLFIFRSYAMNGGIGGAAAAAAMPIEQGISKASQAPKPMEQGASKGAQAVAKKAFFSTVGGKITIAAAAIAVTVAAAVGAIAIILPTQRLIQQVTGNQTAGPTSPATPGIFAPPAPQGTYEDAYEDILSDLWNYSAENSLPFTQGSVLYDFKDLDGDGTPEMLISGIEENIVESSGAIIATFQSSGYAVFSYDDKQGAYLVESGADSAFSPYCMNDLPISTDSNGEYYLPSMTEDGTLVREWIEEEDVARVESLQSDETPNEYAERVTSPSAYVMQADFSRIAMCDYMKDYLDRVTKYAMETIGREVYLAVSDALMTEAVYSDMYPYFGQVIPLTVEQFYNMPYSFQEAYYNETSFVEYYFYLDGEIGHFSYVIDAGSGLVTVYAGLDDNPTMYQVAPEFELNETE